MTAPRRVAPARVLAALDVLSSEAERIERLGRQPMRGRLWRSAMEATTLPLPNGGQAKWVPGVGWVDDRCRYVQAVPTRLPSWWRRFLPPCRQR